MGMETCMTLEMLSEVQAKQLADAGLDYYNHNIDTSPENYANVITTRTFEDRIETLENVRSAGINVCCGGIVGMGETRSDRIGFLHALRSEEHTSELQSLMRISYAVFCLKKNNIQETEKKK